MSTKVDEFDNKAGPVPTLHTAKVHEDHRGNFSEAWNAERCPIPANAKAQINHSHSKLDTLRGLHWQVPPFALTKYVMCLRGEIQDVVVDLRRSSITYGKWNDYILKAEQHLDTRDSLWVPEGFAHGFLVLSATAEVVYLQSGLWDPGAERSLYFNDPEVGIEWLADVDTPYRLSDKDKAAPSLKELGDEDIFD